MAFEDLLLLPAFHSDSRQFFKVKRPRRLLLGKSGHAGLIERQGSWSATGSEALASDFKCLDKGKGKGNFEVSFPVFPNFLGLVLGCIEAKFCK